MEKINVKVFDTLGCTVMATVLFQSLKDNFPNSEIIAYSKFPDLLDGLEEINKAIDSNVHNLEKYDIDLRNYLSKRPHNFKPFQHLAVHMIEHAEEQLKDRLSGNLRKDYSPRIKLKDDELRHAQEIVKSFSKGKPVIWLQTKTGSLNKDWPKEYWQKLINKKSKEYSFIDLSQGDYKPRISIAITKFCDGGITLDSFLLHGSKSVDAKNVIAILGSSRPEVVAYPGQVVIYEINCPVQPCGMHGYGNGCKKRDEHLFTGHEKTRCITDDYRCLRSIAVEKIIQRLDKLFKSGKSSKTPIGD